MRILDADKLVAELNRQLALVKTGKKDEVALIPAINAAAIDVAHI